MPYMMEMPTGQRVEFPDDYPRDKAQALIDRYIEKKYPAPPPGAGKQFLKSLGTSLIPAGGGAAGSFAAMAAAAPLAAAAGPGAPIVEIGAGLIGALGGSTLAAKGQEAAIAAMPEMAKSLGIDPETMAKGAGANPLSARTAELLAFALGFKVKNPLSLFKRIKPGMTEAEAKALIRDRTQARIQAGIGAGLGGATDLGIQSTEEGPTDWSRVAQSTALGALLGEPRALTAKMERGIAGAIPWSKQAVGARAAAAAEAKAKRQDEIAKRQFAAPDREQAKARLRMQGAYESRFPPSMLLPSPEDASTSWNVKGAKYRTREFTSPNPEDWVSLRTIGPNGKIEISYVPRHQVGEGAPGDFTNTLRVPMRPGEPAPPEAEVPDWYAQGRGREEARQEQDRQRQLEEAIRQSEIAKIKGDLRAQAEADATILRLAAPVREPTEPSPPDWYAQGRGREEARQEQDRQRQLEEALRQREIARIKGDMRLQSMYDAMIPRLAAPTPVQPPPGRGMPGEQPRLPFGDEQLEMPFDEYGMPPSPEEPSLYDPNNKQQMLFDLQDQMDLPLTFPREGEQYGLFGDTGVPIGPGGRMEMPPEEPPTAPVRDRNQIPLPGVDTPEMIEARRVIAAIDSGTNIAAMKLRQVGESLGLTFAKNANRGLMEKRIREALNERPQTIQKKSPDETQLEQADGRGTLAADTDTPATGEGVGVSVLGEGAEGAGTAKVGPEDVVRSSVRTEPSVGREEGTKPPLETEQRDPKAEETVARERLLESGAPEEVANRLIQQARFMANTSNETHILWEGSKGRLALVSESTAPPFRAESRQVVARFEPTGEPVPPFSNVRPAEIPGAKPASGFESATGRPEPLPRQPTEARAAPADDITGVRAEERSEPAAEALRRGNLGKALFHLREEGNDLLRWLSDAIFNYRKPLLDRSELVRLEMTRLSKIKGRPLTYSEGMELRNRIMNDDSLTKFDFRDYANDPTAAGKLIVALKDEYAAVDRMVPLPKNAKIDPATGYLAHLNAGKRSGLPRIAFGGAGVHVEGNKYSSAEDRAVIARLKAEGKVAEYDPKKNKFYFTEQGLTNRTILHEMVHAATVRVIKEYLSNGGERGSLTPEEYAMAKARKGGLTPEEYAKAKGNLTPEQYEGVKEVDAIFRATKEMLGEKHASAYENLYEFVSHSMTDEALQAALARLRPADLEGVKLSDVIAINPNARDKTRITTMWNALARAFSKIYNLGKYANYFKKAFYPNLASDALVGDNLLLRVAHSFEDLLAVPKAGTDVEPLAARKKVEVKPDRTVDEIKNTLPKGAGVGGKPIKGTPYEDRTKRIGWGKRIWDTVSTYEGRENLIKNWQNLQVVAKRLTKDLNMAGAHTDLYARMTGATSKAEMNWTATQLIRENMNKAVAGYINKAKITPEEYLKDVHLFSIARDERAARKLQFVMNAPIEAKAAARRDEIIREMSSYEGIPNETVGKRIDALRDELNALVAKNLDPMGESPRRVKFGPRAMSVDIDSPMYNVAGPYTKGELANIRKFYDEKMRAHGPEIEQIFNHIKELQAETIRFNKESGFHPPQLDGIIRFNRRNDYMPYKGDPNQEVMNRLIDINSTRLSGNYSEVQDRQEGRNTDSENPYLQVLSDAGKAAGRAGRKGVPEEVARLIDEGHIDGDFVGTISFRERYGGLVNREDIERPDRIFVNKPNGDTDIWKIKDPHMLEAIKGFTGEAGAFWKFMNDLTSSVGAFHTKFNPSFGPYNFIRDAVTNSMIVSTEMNAKTGARYASAIASKIADGGVFKSMKAANLLHNGNLAELKRLADTDEFYKDLHEYVVDHGGATIYQDAFNIKSQQEKLLKEVGPSNILSNRGQIGKYFQLWSNGFEFASRAAGYRVIRDEMLAKAEAKLGRKLNAKEIEQTKFEATQYVKNLFNFTEVGKFGREAGSIFMFLRPALTGAVRFHEAFAPALQSVEKRIARLPKSITDVDTVTKKILENRKKNSLPYSTDAAKASARKEAEAQVAKNLKTYKEDFARQQSRARMMATTMLGAGAAMYTLAYMMSDTDAQGRNKVGIDNMDLWQRNIRLPVHGLLGKGNDYLMLPWGFGFGAFGAIGAQLAGAAIGNSTLAEAAQNIIPIALDSFIPLPTPQYSPFDHPGAWFVSAMAPSVVRPIVEFSMGVDAFGKEIYTNRINQFSDPYSGGETLPDLYSQISEMFVESTGVVMTPKTVNFFLNSYADGLGRIAATTSGLATTLAGGRDFDLKQDALLISSFIGKSSSYDAREFQGLREKVENYRNDLKVFEDRPDLLAKYMAANPNAQIVVKYYDKYVNGRLRDIRARQNEISRSPYLSRQQKRDMIDDIKLQRDWTMRGIIDALGAWTD